MISGRARRLLPSAERLAAAQLESLADKGMYFGQIERAFALVVRADEQRSARES
jgi:hypothetical protein